MLGEDVSEQEVQILLNLSNIMLEFEKAVEAGDNLMKKQITTQYKKAYKEYQLSMVDAKELASLTAYERKEFEKSIDDEADMMLELSEAIVNGELNEEDIENILQEFDYQF